MIVIGITGCFLLLMVNILLAIHMLYLRRVDRVHMFSDRQLLEAKREEINLISKMSPALDWLVDDAKRDIQVEGKRTRAKVQEVRDIVKQELSDTEAREELSKNESTGGTNG